MPKGRPGGNPDIGKYSFKQQYDWDEPCTAKMSLRVPPTLFEQVKQLPNWQEKVRQAMASLVELENISAQETEKNA